MYQHRQEVPAILATNILGQQRRKSVDEGSRVPGHSLNGADFWALQGARPREEGKQHLHDIAYQAAVEPLAYAEAALGRVYGRTFVGQGASNGAVKLIAAVQNAWGLTDAELASLLGFSLAIEAQLLVNGQKPLPVNDDRADRVRLLYAIHNTLAQLFPRDGDEKRWVRSPLAVLNGKAPLQTMIEGRIPAFVAIRSLVESRLANR